MGCLDIIFVMICLSILLAERVGFEPTVRYKRTPIFKTGAINQLDHLSVSNDSIYISILYCRLSIVEFKFFSFYIIYLILYTIFEFIA